MFYFVRHQKRRQFNVIWYAFVKQLVINWMPTVGLVVGKNEDGGDIVDSAD